MKRFAVMNRWNMNELDFRNEEFSLSERTGMQVTSMTTCIVFSRGGREAFVIHFKDSILMEGFKS